MKLVLQLLLWLVIIFLGWKLYNSVNGPVEFNKAKEVRYTKVIKNLKDMRIFISMFSLSAPADTCGFFDRNFKSAMD